MFRNSRATMSSLQKRNNLPKVRMTARVFSCIGICIGLNMILMSRYFDGGMHLVSVNTQIGTSTIPHEDAIRAIVTTTRKDLQVVEVAHVVSLIKCSRQERVTGFLDAAAVLRHSIHKNSIHSGTSKYSYKMYAIVHEDCKEHAHSLDSLGYHALVKPSPIKVEEIADGYLKGHVEMENCCGSAEFIK